jgi:O-antigen ligase
VTSALSGADSSVVGHQEAIEHGIDSAVDNPLGLGLGQGDHLGSAIAISLTGDPNASEGVGENLYLAMFVSVGPIGLVLFGGWLLGVGKSLLPTLRPPSTSWARIAMLALLIGFIIASTTASMLLRFTTAATFWLLLGMAVPIQSRAVAHQQDEIHAT